MAAVSCKVAGILCIVAGVDRRDLLSHHFPVDVDEGEEARIGQGLAGPVATYPLDAGLDADKAVISVNHPRGIVELVPHPHRLEEVDSINGDNDGTVGGRQC